MSERIALGLGDNVDYEITWDSAIYEELCRCYAIQPADLVMGQPIRNERDLICTILAYFEAGKGGERWVASSEIVEQFTARFVNKITLGGSSVRAAIAMRKLGYTSALHLVTINEHVRRLIPNDSPYVCSNTQDTLYPHLIVQFQQGAAVRTDQLDLRAPRANRLIFHNDVDNINMALNENFADLCADAQVFLVSGFNAMHDEALLRERLQTLQRILDRLPQNARVFYEDAGFYDHSFTGVAFEQLAGRLDIVSMNEDELQVYLDRSVDVLDAVDVLAALDELRRIVPAPVLVLHSMYWALVNGVNAAAYEVALRGGTTMATTRYIYGDDFTAELYCEIEAAAPNPDGAVLAGALAALRPNEICCIPVAYVACESPTTIGLGDAFVGGFLPAMLT